MKNILITSAGKRVVLVEIFRKTLKDLRLSARVYTTDLKPDLAPACIKSDGGFAVPRCDSEGYIRSLQDLCRELQIAPGSKELAEKVWKSIIYPPSQDPYQEGSPRYYLSEARTFLANRWKYKMAYPDESYTLLMFKYAWLGIRKMTGLLKTEK